MPSKQTRNLLAVGLVILHVIILGLAIYSWGKIYGWKVHSGYELFPVLGLSAFSLMWIHYVAAAINRFYHNAFDLKTYFQWTGYAVLLLILLHPGILTYSLWRDGLGLPLGSEFKYVGKNGELAIIFAVTAWLIFLMYEVINRLKHTQFWPVMVGLNDIAMFLIIFHARWLGTSLQLHWFRALWTFYAVVLLFCIAQRLYFVYQRHNQPVQTGA